MRRVVIGAAVIGAAVIVVIVVMLLQMDQRLTEILEQASEERD
jgi:hypothetical protein